MARTVTLACCLLMCLLASSGCDQDVLTEKCSLVVLNNGATELTVFVDGEETFTVRASSDASLDDIGPGRHVLEALDDRGVLVKRQAIELAGGEDYYWVLAGR